MVSSAQAEGNTMTFSFIAQENCLYGGPGTFTPDGDVTNYYGGIGAAFGAGTITFDLRAGKAVEAANWMFQQQMGAPPPTDPPTPLNVYPVRTSAGQCELTLVMGPKLSFTLEGPPQGCTSTDVTGPTAGQTFTFTGGPGVQGQFAADMRSFTAHRIALGVETGTDQSGGTFERICMRAVQGSRVPVMR
jgi:hypothetical protein